MIILEKVDNLRFDFKTPTRFFASLFVGYESLCALFKKKKRNLDQQLDHDTYINCKQQQIMHLVG